MSNPTEKKHKPWGLLASMVVAIGFVLNVLLLGWVFVQVGMTQILLIGVKPVPEVAVDVREACEVLSNAMAWLVGGVAFQVVALAARLTMMVCGRRASRKNNQAVA